MSHDNDGHIKIEKWHESPEAFHAYCSNPLVKTAHSSGCVQDVSDWGGETYDGALKQLIYGCTDRAVLARKLFDDVVEANIDTMGRNIIQSAVVGHTPNVPAMIAGLPESMLTRTVTQQMSSNAPIRIIVDLFASCTITQQQFIRRGVAALAFTMVMSTLRPIDLYAAHTGGSMWLPGSSVAHMIRIDTRPLDLPRAVWMLSDPAFFRRLGFCSMLHELRPYQQRHKAKQDYMEDCIPPTRLNGPQWLKLEPEDIYIERLLSGNHDAIKDPMKWVNNMIKQHMTDIEMSSVLN